VRDPWQGERPGPDRALLPLVTGLGLGLGLGGALGLWLGALVGGRALGS